MAVGPAWPEPVARPLRLQGPQSAPAWPRLLAYAWPAPTSSFCLPRQRCPPRMHRRCVAQFLHAQAPVHRSGRAKSGPPKLPCLNLQCSASDLHSSMISGRHTCLPFKLTCAISPKFFIVPVEPQLGEIAACLRLAHRSGGKEGSVHQSAGV